MITTSEEQERIVRDIHEKTKATRIVYYDAQDKVIKVESREFYPFNGETIPLQAVSGLSWVAMFDGERELWRSYRLGCGNVVLGEPVTISGSSLREKANASNA